MRNWTLDFKNCSEDDFSRLIETIRNKGPWYHLRLNFDMEFPAEWRPRLLEALESSSVSSLECIYFHEKQGYEAFPLSEGIVSKLFYLGFSFFGREECIGDRGLEQLGEILKKQNSVRSLSLQMEACANKMLTTLAEILNCNSSVVTLRLNICGCCDGMGKVAKVIAEKNSLESLDLTLGINVFENREKSILGLMPLRSCTSLRHFKFTLCDPTSEERNNIGLILRANVPITNLKVFDMESGSTIPESDEAILQNNTITELEIYTHKTQQRAAHNFGRLKRVHEAVVALIYLSRSSHSVFALLPKDVLLYLLFFIEIPVGYYKDLNERKSRYLGIFDSVEKPRLSSVDELANCFNLKLSIDDFLTNKVEDAYKNRRSGFVNSVTTDIMGWLLKNINSVEAKKTIVNWIETELRCFHSFVTLNDFGSQSPILKVLHFNKILQEIPAEFLTPISDETQDFDLFAYLKSKKAELEKNQNEFFERNKVQKSSIELYSDLFRTTCTCRPARRFSI